ncbi:hypothetical protein E2C01_092454 [Portunus trituberculatus]|uniref:Uncharacterized protein n=1 Tax=Portunus trituberculatus TaxID=210409 RepID=A0A5B7JQL9_PORTR|nr:hypothetical protein [Portunus trituberculatus]
MRVAATCPRLEWFISVRS